MTSIGHAYGDTYSAGTYTYWNRGSARSLALGGNSVAERVHSGSFLNNQAAMVNQEYALDGTIVYGEPEDKSVSLQNANLVTHRYLMVGGSLYLFKRLAFGLGLEQLRFIARSNSQSIREFSDSVLEVNASVALRVTDSFSLSTAFVRTVSRRDTTLQDDTEDTVNPSIFENGDTAKIGLMWQMTSLLRFGATHRFASTMRAEKQTGNLFAQSYIPQKTELGLAISFVPESTKKSKPGFLKIAKLLLQADIMSFPNLDDKLYYAPAVAYNEQDKYELNTHDAVIPRAGLELGLLTYKYFELTGLAGCYREPAFTVSSSPRNHVTFGAHMRIWFLVTNIALDYSKDYINKNIEVTLARSSF